MALTFFIGLSTRAMGLKYQCLNFQSKISNGTTGIGVFCLKISWYIVLGIHCPQTNNLVRREISEVKNESTLNENNNWIDKI
ncbi:hypothetical protein O9G_003013 [Rozella allomycis CSF55]|uniref:Uncharacterized protein n=1 Tax=Rozella allomycis (strain CSF55) TaxID=988480 RepID=A0A075AVK2_ROZAC|nr:hypothetical protein O9G_003013 [Rozella allomycis CSF55]|eukprot:EPZ34293.1 hypothetical protein O9G_003013 [Rozella allomycis CSF55]